jgi:hypothetical protein
MVKRTHRQVTRSRFTKLTKIRYNLLLDRPTLEKLEAFRWATGMTVSTQIRMAIDAWLARDLGDSRSLRASIRQSVESSPDQA